MIVQFSELALAELDVVLGEIRRNDSLAAARFAERIQRAVDRIGQFPKGAQKVKERSNVWRVPLVRYPYSIYYTVAKKGVMILRIIHGARQNPWQ